jgi:hypothetical protein
VAQLAQRRSTREDWLAEPENPQPAHDPSTQYVAAPPKVLAALAQAAKCGDAAKVVNLIGPNAARELARHLSRAAAAVDEWRRQNPATSSSPAPKRIGTGVPRRGHVGARQPRPKRRTLSRSSSRSGDSGPSDLDPPPRLPVAPEGVAGW